jgi:hypothetical protein
MKIAFSGRASSGKDTCVDILLEKYGGHRTKFADELYSILSFAQSICGFEMTKDRKFLEFVGTEWARQKDPNVWIKTWKKHFLSISPFENVFVSDVRFRNEIEELKRNKFKIVRIERPGIERRDTTSEKELDDFVSWDAIVENSGTLEDLKVSLDKLIEICYPKNSKF